MKYKLLQESIKEVVSTQPLIDRVSILSGSETGIVLQERTYDFSTEPSLVHTF
jgi:hypothetical protein